jgi:hypothetical protein
MDVGYEQMQEMLDAKKVECIAELMDRLQRETIAYRAISQQIAWAKSREVTDKLELTVADPPADGESNGHEAGPVDVLMLQRRKVMEAMRASLYHATNRMKQYTQQGKESFDKNRAVERVPEAEPLEA